MKAATRKAVYRLLVPRQSSCTRACVCVCNRPPRALETKKFHASLRTRTSALLKQRRSAFCLNGFAAAARIRASERVFSRSKAAAEEVIGVYRGTKTRLDECQTCCRPPRFVSCRCGGWFLLSPTLYSFLLLSLKSRCFCHCTLVQNCFLDLKRDVRGEREA